MGNIKRVHAAITFVALFTPTIAASQVPSRITGVGGIFVTSKDLKALAAWYHDVLGISMESWAALSYTMMHRVTPQ